MGIFTIISQDEIDDAMLEACMELSNKDKSLIPKGEYCYSRDNGVFKICKYWRVINERPEQYNGWCDYLEQGDLEISKETIMVNYKTGEKTNGSDMPFPVSLLWDQCKECELNLN